MSSENNQINKEVSDDASLSKASPQTASVPENQSTPEVRQEEERVEFVDRQTVFNGYQQGIANGAIGVDPQPFSNFIGNFYESQTQLFAIHQLQSVIKLEEARQRLANERLPLLMSEVQVAKSGFEQVKVRQELHDVVWKRSVERLQGIKSKLIEIKEEYKTDYTLFAGIIFFAAAILFMLADFSIALSIVADSLKIGTEMEGEGIDAKITYNWQAYGFAGALSLLAIVLKPAYDRLVEKKFLKGSGAKAFNLTITISAFFVLVLLFSLGIFRENAIAQINQSQFAVQSVQVQSSITGSPELQPADVPAQTNNYALNPNTVVEEPGFKEKMGSFGVILSTVLFAVAGAICLGISIPVLHKNYRIGYNYAMQAMHRRRIAKSEKVKSEVESNVKDLESILSLKEELLKAEKIILDGKSETIEKQHQLLDLYKAYYEVRGSQEQQLYLDGYSKGQLIKGTLPDEWATQKVLQGNLSPMADDGENTEATGGGQYSRTRPFVAVRKMISQRFRRNYFNFPDNDVELYDNEN